MKQKYLLSMLLGGAMLTACSVEDDLKLSPVAEEANQTAPVFTVSFDNDGDPMTRAYLYGQNGDAQNNKKLRLQLEEQDLLSFYNGTEAEDDGTVKFAKWHHAIYKGKYDDGSGDLKFTTTSMVQPGKAILIWPSDQYGLNGWEGANNGMTTPKIRVPQKQSELTKDSTAYMSEVITIDKLGTRNASTVSGYNQDYDNVIVMKRAAGTLVMNMSLTGTKISATTKPAGVTKGAELKEVKLTASKKVFTTEIPVKGTAEPSVMQNLSSNPKVRPSWNNQSILDTKAGNDIIKDEWISTTDTKKETVNGVEYQAATFTLLPADEDILGNEGTAKYSGTGDNQVNVPYYAGVNGGITVYTNYGKVDLANSVGTAASTDLTQAAAKDKVWTAGDGKVLTTEAGINYVLKGIWSEATSGSYYNSNLTPKRGEKIGKAVVSFVNVNLDNLDMHNLHIEDQEHLLNAIKVYNAIKNESNNPNKNKHINFYLDGDANGNFYLDKDGLLELSKATTTADYSKLHISPCGERGEACTTIQVTNGSDELELPALCFDKVDEAAVNPMVRNSEANVKLIGKWAYNSAEDNTETTADERKRLDGIKTVTLTGNGTTMKFGEYVTATGNVELVVEDKAEVNVDDVTYLEISVTNKSKIKVGTKGDLRVKRDDKKVALAGATHTVVLENCEAQGATANGWSIGGEIEVKGYLGIVNNSGAKINNYGWIYQSVAGATVMVSVNADDNITDDNMEMLTTKFSNGKNVKEGTTVVTTKNRIGTIKLFEGTPSNGVNNVNVLDPERQGFILVDVTTSNAAKSAYGTIANYARIKNVTGVKFGDGDTGMPDNIKYVEIESNSEVVFTTPAITITSSGFSGGFSLRGLFVRNATRINIPRYNGLKTKYTFINESNAARIGYPGEFEWSKLEGYFGGDAKVDINRIISVH